MNSTKVFGPGYGHMDIPPMREVVKRYSTESQMENIVRASNYSHLKGPSIYAAIVLHEGAPKWNYSLRLNMSDVPSTDTWTDDLRRGMDKQYQNQYFTGVTISKGLDVYPGFMSIQAAMDRYIINRTDILKPSATFDALALFGTVIAYLNQSAPYLSLEQLEAFYKTTAGQEAAVNVSKSALFAPQHVFAVPFPIHGYSSNSFYPASKGIFALFFLLTFLLPAFRLIRGIVHEKETKIREGMKMMGMGDLSLFLAWYITYGVVFCIIAFGVTIVAGSGIFSGSSPFVIFLFFWLFGLSSIAYCFVISTIFSRAKTAATVGAVAYTAAFFPYYAVNKATSSTIAKVLASFCSPAAFGLSLDVITSFEGEGQGVGFGNLFDDYQKFSAGIGITMMALDFVLYTVLGWYLDNVIPGEFGQRKSLYFCCTRAYCRGKPKPAPRGRGRGKGRSSVYEPLLGVMDEAGPGTASDMNGHSRSVSRASSSSELDSDGGGDYSGSVAIGGAQPPNVEAVPPALRHLERDHRCIKLRGLSKVFSTPDGPKQAVDHLSMSMYEGQIFALLGHNGAGKTTTIGVLTGLLEASGGSASIYGMDVATEMSEIRHSMGVCPQHDVLWDDLTVREHLEYFAGLKGVPRSKVAEQVRSKIEEVGLTEKIHTNAGELSGGQRRKLSVAIALIGDSRVVFLDEPTSGECRDA